MLDVSQGVCCFPQQVRQPFSTLPVLLRVWLLLDQLIRQTLL